METTKELYTLRQESRNHEKGIRTLCVLSQSGSIVTGGCDGLVIVWTTTTDDRNNKSSNGTPATRQQDEGGPVPLEYHPDLLLSEHVGTVYSLCDGGASQGNDNNTDETFFSGGQDKKVLWVTTKGKKLQTFNVRVMRMFASRRRISRKWRRQLVVCSNRGGSVLLVKTVTCWRFFLCTPQ